MSVNIDEKIERIVHDSIAELNEQRPEDFQLLIHQKAYLYGKNGALDSLALVQLIVALEQRCESDFGVRPNLTTYFEQMEEDMPFSSINNLCLYLTTLYK